MAFIYNELHFDVIDNDKYIKVNETLMYKFTKKDKISILIEDKILYFDIQNSMTNKYFDNMILSVPDHTGILCESNHGYCEISQGGCPSYLSSYYNIIRFKKEGIYNIIINNTKYSIYVKDFFEQDNKYDILPKHREQYKENLGEGESSNGSPKKQRQDILFWKEYIALHNLHSYLPKFDNIFPEEKSIWQKININSKMMYSYMIDKSEENKIYPDFVLSYIDDEFGVEQEIKFKRQLTYELPQTYINKHVNVEVIMYKGEREKPCTLKKNCVLFYVILEFIKKGTYLVKKVMKNDIKIVNGMQQENTTGISIITVE